MKFCDKLPKLRKDNNLSQEQLADRMNVSRQAISKWESGSSYPDMEKMIQLCNILNCTLNDLMDDGIISNDSGKSNKKEDKNYLNEFLNFITKTTNMFYSMKFKEKIKCIFELLFLGIILFIIGAIIMAILSMISSTILSNLNYGLYNRLYNMVTIIYFSILLILGIIVFIHIFKIRYLDYFVTVEDQNVTNKTVEEPIEKRNIVEKKREKIIIRDPKHSISNFIGFLEKIIIFMIKCFILMLSIPVIFSFLFLIFLFILSLCHIKYNTIFIFLLILGIGSILFNYVVLEIIFKFITNQKQSLKKIFILFITSFILIGVGGGLSFNRFLNLNHETTKLNYKMQTEYITLKNDTIINNYYNFDIEYKIDNSLTDKLKLEIYYSDDYGYTYDLNKHVYEDKTYYHIGLENNSSVFEIYKYLLKDIKNNKITTIDTSKQVKLKVYMNQDTYNNTVKDDDVMLYYPKNNYIANY